MKKCLICLCLLLCLFSTAYAYPSLEDIGEYARVNNPDPNDRLNQSRPKLFAPGGFKSITPYFK